MIREFELRLADVLGSRLPAPFTGQVDPAPAIGPPGDQPRIIVGVQRFHRLTADFDNQRHLVVPGAELPRRVVRLACEVACTVQPSSDGGRTQQLTGVDALVYTLDDPAFAGTLAAPGDPGFLLDSFELTDAATALDPSLSDSPLIGVTARAVGVFWPPGVAGQAGPTIEAIRIRQAGLPIQIVLPAQRLVSGGGPATPSGVRLVDLTGGTGEITYTPPAEEATDLLVVALEDGVGGPGVELSRTALTVGST
jgi:hypothetical protein